MQFLAYLDFNQRSSYEDLEFAAKLGLDSVILTKYDNELLSNLSDNSIKTINKDLKKTKMTVYATEFSEFHINLHDEDKYNDLVESFENHLKITTKLKVKNMIFTLPLLDDILLKVDIIVTHLKGLYLLAKKYKINLMFKQGENRNSNLVYLLKKMPKEFNLVFEPANIYANGESSIVAYRHFKKKVTNVLVSDLDSLGNSELVGYGKVGIIDLFKRFKRDKFNGNLILDPNFIIYDQNTDLVLEKEKKTSFFKRLFKKKTKVSSYLEGFGERIFPGEGKTPTLFEIYDSQIKALKVIFNLD